MKKIFTLILSFVLILGYSINVHASETETFNSDGFDQPAGLIDLGDGIIIDYVITEESTNTRSSSKTATKTATCSANGKVIATVKLTATFVYTGSSATCTSASATHTLSSGWSYSNQSITRSGNKASVSAKLTGPNNYANITTSMTCSNTGTIS